MAVRPVFIFPLVPEKFFNLGNSVMKQVHWVVDSFHDFTPDQLYNILQLRVDVFVVEQCCPYPELDDSDRHPETRHLAGHDQSGALIAYARLLPPGLRFPEPNIGRFVVKKDSRGQGVGHQLLREAVKEINKIWPGHPIKISAQDYLQRFYERYGFIRMSDVYLEDEIPHIEMLRKV